jgi:uncharacterized protein
MQKLFLFFIIFLTTSCMKNHDSINSKVFALRLKPGEDLKEEIMRFAKENKIEAGYIITCVGSLKKANLRLANQPTTQVYNEKFEIVSLVGTFSGTSGGHLHISISDSTGKTIGGHLAEGNIIYTTAEIVIGEITDVKFLRKLDSTTTYNELFVEKK